MTCDIEDTIVAIASPPGGGGRGIVRLGGPNAVACVGKVFLADDGLELTNQRAAVCIPGTAKVVLPAPQRAAKLPADLYLWPTERSYTRQPVAELHTLGSPPLLDALLQAICRSGARLAAPGEFTLRAFLAGRLDLAQAEAVLGVIQADTPRQLQGALGQLAGGVSGPLHAIREELLNILAELEAGLDFVDEDIEFIAPGELDRRLQTCEAVVAATLGQLARREDRPAEFLVVLVGPPNAGKSSLFNALVRRYGRAAAAPAIVSSQPGTTRDFLVARIDAGGHLCELVDTAGMADAQEQEQSTQIERASAQAADAQRCRADLVLDCIDASMPENWRHDEKRKCILPVQTESLAFSDRQKRWSILTKSDLAGVESLGLLAGRVRVAAVTSAHYGAGLETLIERIAVAAAESVNDSGSAVAATANRCRESLLACAQSLAEARKLAADGCAEELVAVDLREALQRLGLVVGAVYTDDILDRIFSRFCIGK